MRKYLRSFIVALSVVFILSLSLSALSFAGNDNKRGQYAKNIIFMVPDGMGNAYVTATRIFKNGPNGDPLYLETLPQIGYQRTHSANSTVTDSAAAASAWSCGEKFNNGEICCNVDAVDYSCDASTPLTIL